MSAHNKLENPSGYTICEWSKSKNGIKGRIKSPIIWGHAKERNCIFPVAYLRKPKWNNAEANYRKRLNEC